MTFKPWQPGKILITGQEVSDSIAYANHMGWYFCPSPVNAAFVSMLAIMDLYEED